jgi:long-chain acyl-CoA synthetase
VLRRTYWAGWTGAAFGNPLTSLVSRLAQASQAWATVLRLYPSLVWFAEGERSLTGSLQPFKPGVGMLLSYYPVPVVPVFIRGTYEAMPRGRFLRRLEQVTVSFGEPVDPDGLDEASRSQEQIVQAVRERVAALGAR